MPLSRLFPMEGGRGPQGQSIDTNCTVVIHETLQAVHNLLLTVINKNYNREKNTHSHAWASLQCQEQYDEGEGERTRVSGE